MVTRTGQRASRNQSATVTAKILTTLVRMTTVTATALLKTTGTAVKIRRALNETSTKSAELRSPLRIRRCFV
jgi:hypothetical protein